jgi:CDP-glycerol glycerophosphotransferase (TagB/SpsB family)/glycosyltransferase involved in cell wall biosynthesis
MSTKKYPYKFSIVTAIYNTEEYVSDAIESVINQTIGFEDNVQLILVNDGSTDRSGEICKKYRDRYPNNIVYIKKENGGVSSARNRGLEEVRGKYVNFLDSDDKLSKNTLKEVWKFFEKHYNEIDFVSIPIYFFEGSQSQHSLNFRFNESRVVDIIENPTYIQLSVASSFFKSSVVTKYSFKENLAYAEDVRLLNEILMNKQKYGIVSNTKYLYRKRITADSVMQKTTTTKDWYFDTLEDGFLEILEIAKENFNVVPKYYQYLVMYDLQYRIKLPDLGILKGEEKNKYLSIIKSILHYVSDDVIFAQKHYTQEHMLLALSLKYGIPIEKIIKEIKERDGKIYFRNTLFPRFEKTRLDLRTFEIKDNNLLIEGLLKTVENPQDLDLCIKYEDKSKKLTIKPFRHGDVIALEQKIIKGYRFKVEINIKEVKSLQLLSGNRSIQYYWGKGLTSRYIIKQKPKRIIHFLKDRIVIQRYNIFNHIYLEIQYALRLLRRKELKVVAARLLYYFLKIFKFKPLWLFVDRPYKAGENAQVLFEYAVKQKDDIKKVFLLDKNSEDFNTVKKIGEVYSWRSIKHLISVLLSDKIVSSQADEHIINPFGRWGKYLRDLFTYDFVFLQHGVIQNDLSNWLNRFEKNIKVFVTSAKPEYRSIIEGDYLYSKKEVVLTGLPRFDKLKNNPKKKILLMPTWRENLAVKANNLGIRGRNEKFKQSEYYRFFNSLINNKKLLSVLEESGYRVKFCLHPSLIANAGYFNTNKYVNVSKKICDYTTEFNEGSLLVTDYSSVAFDFAYLRKPIVYSQFDLNSIYNKHTFQKGYFDYEKDGFGPVCEDLDSTVDSIIKILENDCKLEKEYRDRIDRFFEYSDRNNCERVYEKIIEIDN